MGFNSAFKGLNCTLNGRETGSERAEKNVAMREEQEMIEKITQLIAL